MPDEPTRDIPLTPTTRVQFQPGPTPDLWMLVVDGEDVGSVEVLPEMRERMAELPTADAYEKEMAPLWAMLKAQGAPSA